MKRQKYILTIDKPCKQEWTSMTKADIGKFCSQCSKTVVDFTHLTDNEIVQIIEQSSGKLCGRLRNQQLNRILATNQPTNSSRLYKILLGLFLVGATKNSFASDRLPSHVEIVSITDKGILKIAQLKTQEEPTTDSLKNVVQGKVVDANTKEPLSFAWILIKDTKTGVLTDLDGKFKLMIPDSLVTDQIYLVVTYVGYEKTEIAVNKKDLPIINDLVVVPAEQILMGDVIITKKRKWWRRKKKSHR